MPRFNEQMIVALAEHTNGEKYSQLQAVVEKNGLTLFTLISPSNIQRIEAEAGANPNIINEAVSLTELADCLGMFYSDITTPSNLRPFFDQIVEMMVIARTRSRRVEGSNAHSLHPSVMQEYFTDDSITNFLYQNPVFVGLYIYILITSISSS